MIPAFISAYRGFLKLVAGAKPVFIYKFPRMAASDGDAMLETATKLCVEFEKIKMD